MKVMVQPSFSTSLRAKAKKGIMWPCAMNGNMMKCSFVSDILLCLDDKNQRS